VLNLSWRKATFLGATKHILSYGRAKYLVFLLNLSWRRAAVLGVTKHILNSMDVTKDSLFATKCIKWASKNLV